MYTNTSNLLFHSVDTQYNGSTIELCTETCITTQELNTHTHIVVGIGCLMARQGYRGSPP
jgi:hypothetical protein